MFLTRLSFLLMIFCGSCYANISESDVNKLSQVKTFSIGLNGFAGRTSEGEKLYKKISKERNAIKKFKTILESDQATPEAKLYALCGLKGKNIDANYLMKFHRVERSASVLKGDILRKLVFPEVYETILSKGC
ncbi:MchS3 family protein [Pantoea sp. FN060301]|uniref:MchS3 family protein n=1 Tax=Pantoea sp. FN060301 TaxID=3420380 RepID=UPI003D167ABC